MSEGSLASFLADAATSVTALQGFATGWFEIVMAEPALFVMIIGIPLTGFGIGILQRIFNLG